MSSGLSGEKEIQDIVFKCILNVLIPRAADTDTELYPKSTSCLTFPTFKFIAAFLDKK